MPVNNVISIILLITVVNLSCYGAANREWLNTKLIEAALDGKISDVQMLLGIKADANAIDQGGRSVLRNTVGLSGVINQAEIVYLLIEAGANVNSVDKKKNTPLMVATDCGHIELVKILLAQETFLDEVNANGETALIIAAKKGYHRIVQLLLDKGVDIGAENRWRQTAWDVAVKKGHVEVVALLNDYLQLMEIFGSRNARR